MFDLRDYDVTLFHDNAIKFEFIYRYRVLPLYRDQNNLHLGVSDPTDYKTFSTVSFHTGLRIRLMLVSENELDRVINTYCRPGVLDKKLQTALSRISPAEEPFPYLENNQPDEGPMIEFVNRLIQDAILKHVSDIHIEPYEQHCRIRFRRDGLLFETATLPHTLNIRVITRLKILAELNIAERRLPQDGRIFQINTPDEMSKIDIRVNICPPIFGEKMVLRLLDTKKINHDIGQFGFSAYKKHCFLQKIQRPQGLIFVSGPTGSGKTVTLYSALNYLNQTEKNISSVEDPVEINLTVLIKSTLIQK